MRNVSEKRKKKNSFIKNKKVLFFIILLIPISIASAIYGYGYYIYSKSDNITIDRDSVLNDSGRKEESKYITNILLLGVDRGISDGGNDGLQGLADSIMILTINNSTKEIKLSSILRDTTLNIPGYGEKNINNAMYLGGADLMLKTVNYNFDLDIDKFVAVNLSSLPQIIDALGGLDMSISNEELKYINNYIDNINKKNDTSYAHLSSAGYQHLNGTQAAAYCRIRYTEGNDFKRTERQRDTLSLIAKKASNLPVSKINNLILDNLNLVQTNLSYNEIISIITKALAIGTSNIEQNRFPNDGDHWSTGTGTNNDYRLNINLDATKEKMHKFIYNQLEKELFYEYNKDK